ncbi:MAG: arsenical pump-driving ATPase [Bdellovibrionia bacterium]
MQKKIHLVTGKGGVGKSVLAAALALRESQRGSSLLAELGDRSFYQDFLGLGPVSYHPTRYQSVDVVLWSGADCLREYAKYLIKVDSLTKLFFENSVMRTFVNIAPALPELAIMGKVTSGPRRHGPPLKYDYLTVDAFATGHFLALMRAAPAMAQAIPFGPMGEQGRGILKTLQDKELCEYHIVTLPEELPLKETLELKAQLESEFGVIPKIYLNKAFNVHDNFRFPESDFGEYLKFQVSKTKFAQDYLNEKQISFTEIPWFLHGTGAEIVQSVVEVLK